MVPEDYGESKWGEKLKGREKSREYERRKTKVDRVEKRKLDWRAILLKDARIEGIVEWEVIGIERKNRIHSTGSKKNISGANKRRGGMDWY